MPAHLTPILLLLANPLAGGGAVDSEASPRVAVEASVADVLREEVDTLLAAHARAAAAAEAVPGMRESIDLAWRSRFVELAEQGSGRATAWLLRSFPLAEAAPRAEVDARLELYSMLAREDADAAWLVDSSFDVFAALLRDAPALGRAHAIELAERFARASTRDETRATALATAGYVTARWFEHDPGDRALARERHAEVIARFPESSQAERSREELWRLSKLVVGKPAPEFITRDVDGNEIRSADLRRRVLVVEFWSEQTPGIRAWAAHRRELAQRHGDDRFFLLGVNLDADPQRFRRSLETLEIEWTNAFEGDAARQAVWRLRESGTNLVLDADGVVRFANVHGPALDAAVASLIDSEPSSGSAPKSSIQAGGAQAR